MRTSKLHAVLAAVAVVGIACPGPDDPTQPVVAWESALSGANEIPATTSTATATADYTLATGGPSDTLVYTVTIGTPLSAASTQAHLHTGAPNANGAISIWLCTTAGVTGAPAGTPTCATGTAAGALTTGRTPISAAQLNTLRAFGLYTNVHTTAFTAGEIRGQARNIVP